MADSEAHAMTEIYESLESVSGIARQPVPKRKRLLHWLGIDKAVGFAGLVTVALIARFLSPAEQGYYYTFGSLIALQIVFELGFSLVILQMASHERAHLTVTLPGLISGDAVAHARLASVLQKTVRWYTAAAAFLAIFLVAAGLYFFSSHQHSGATVSWRSPWCTAAIAASITFQLDPILSFMEGCGFVANVARLRLAQAVIGSTLAWLVLIAHHGLFAPAMVIIGNASVASVWLFRKRQLLWPLLRHEIGEHRIHWMKEVWPFQWRIAVSWLSGYFIFQLYNPVLFAFRGPVEAGQMGMSLSLTGALLSVAVSWINTKAAPFGGMIARKDFAQLDSVFFLSVKQGLAVCMVGALTVWLGIVYMDWAHIPLAHRVLEPISLGMVLITAPINVIVFAQATYLRAHKQEKFLLNSVLGAVLVALSTYFLGKSYGAFGIALGSLILSVVVGLPLATYIFSKYRRIWHAA
jgi:O-antigen/teichoic acid export membrane protein